MTAGVVALAAAVIALASAVASAAVLRMIRRNPPPRQRRGRRKSGELVPLAGGLAIVPVVAAAWLLAAALGIAPGGAVAALVMAGLASLALQEMRTGMPPLYRYTAQAIAVVLGLIFLPGSGRVFQGLLSATLDLVFATLVWMAAMQAVAWHDRREGQIAIWLVSTGLGAAATAALAGDRDSGALALGSAMAAAALGYLPWAWPPARLLLGLVGTIPLGYAVAWLLLGLSGRGHWAAALILSAPLLGHLVEAAIDARGARRAAAPAAAPSRKRAAALRARSPGADLARILGSEILLAGLAAVSVFWPWPALLAAAPIVLRLRRSLAGLSGLGFLGI